jgi:hypothetical protein
MKLAHREIFAVLGYRFYNFFVARHSTPNCVIKIVNGTLAGIFIKEKCYCFLLEFHDVSAIISNMIPAKTVKPAKSRLRIANLIIVLLLVTVAGVVGYILNRNHQQDVKDQAALVQDKAILAQGESDMDKAYADILTAIGKPEVEEKGKSCARSQQKFSEGNLNCGIMYTFAYPEDSAVASVVRTMKLQESLKNSPYFLGSEFGFNPQPVADENNFPGSDMYIKSKIDLICNVVYRYSVPNRYSDYGFNKIKAEHFTFYQFSCIKDVALPVYPS